MKNHYLITTITAMLISFASTVFAQNVFIPDSTFKAYLLNNGNINTNHDGEIQATEAAKYAGGLDCSDKSITDLTGIEAFTELLVLDCVNNHLTTLNLSANTKLVYLYCRSNELTYLNVSTCTALETINCEYNKLTDLNLLGNTKLKILNCNYNNIDSLNFSANTALAALACENNQLTNLDFSNNTALVYLKCSNNELTDLNILANTKLEKLYCANNTLAHLDLSKNTELVEIYCSNNPQLTALNIQNGNNHNIVYYNFNDNSNLTCIQVDDVEYANSNFDLVNTPAEFSLNCTGTAVAHSPANLALPITILPNPNTGVFTIMPQNLNAPLAIQIVNAMGKTVLTREINPTVPTSINLLNQPKGVYFLVATQKNGNTTTQKIVVQ